MFLRLLDGSKTLNFAHVWLRALFPIPPPIPKTEPDLVCGQENLTRGTA
jgi:hypothetical protein